MPRIQHNYLRRLGFEIYRALDAPEEVARVVIDYQVDTDISQLDGPLVEHPMDRSIRITSVNSHSLMTHPEPLCVPHVRAHGPDLGAQLLGASCEVAHTNVLAGIAPIFPTVHSVVNM